MTETFKAKVAGYANERLHIEIPQIYREDFPKGTKVKIIKLSG